LILFFFIKNEMEDIREYMKANQFDKDRKIVNNYLSLENCVDQWPNELTLDLNEVLARYNK
jgi:hypothetical protein